MEKVNKFEMDIIIYTDGGCNPNPGKGAFAAILMAGDRKAITWGYAPWTTNNAMELCAVIAALHALKPVPKRLKVGIKLDSEYVYKGITHWMNRWKVNGWKSGQDQVKNAWLWAIAYDLLQEVKKYYQVEFDQIPGHKLKWNNYVDDMCTKIIDAEGDLSERTDRQGVSWNQMFEYPLVERVWEYPAPKPVAARTDAEVNTLMQNVVNNLRGVISLDDLAGMGM